MLHFLRGDNSSPTPQQPQPPTIISTTLSIPTTPPSSLSSDTQIKLKSTFDCIYIDNPPFIINYVRSTNIKKISKANVNNLELNPPKVVNVVSSSSEDEEKENYDFTVVTTLTPDIRPLQNMEIELPVFKQFEKRHCLSVTLDNPEIEIIESDEENCVEPFLTDFDYCMKHNILLSYEREMKRRMQSKQTQRKKKRRNGAKEKLIKQSNGAKPINPSLLKANQVEVVKKQEKKKNERVAHIPQFTPNVTIQQKKSVAQEISPTEPKHFVANRKKMKTVLTQQSSVFDVHALVKETSLVIKPFDKITIDRPPFLEIVSSRLIELIRSFEEDIEDEKYERMHAVEDSAGMRTRSRDLKKKNVKNGKNETKRVLFQKNENERRVHWQKQNHLKTVSSQVDQRYIEAQAIASTQIQRYKQRNSTPPPPPKPNYKTISIERCSKTFECVEIPILPFDPRRHTFVQGQSIYKPSADANFEYSLDCADLLLQMIPLSTRPGYRRPTDSPFCKAMALLPRKRRINDRYLNALDIQLGNVKILPLIKQYIDIPIVTLLDKREVRRVYHRSDLDKVVEPIDPNSLEIVHRAYELSERNSRRLEDINQP